MRFFVWQIELTILRDGQYVTTLNTDETNKDELVKYMVGRQLTEVYPKT